MNEELLNLNLKVESVENLEGRVKFKGAGKSFSFFTDKQDGSQTAASRGWNALQVKPGSVISIGYKQKPYKDGYVNSVMTVKPAEAVPNTIPAQNSFPRAKFEATEAPRGGSDDAFGRRLAIHGFVNAKLSFGTPAKEIDLDELLDLENRIEEKLSGVPGVKVITPEEVDV